MRSPTRGSSITSLLFRASTRSLCLASGYGWLSYAGQRAVGSAWRLLSRIFRFSYWSIARPLKTTIVKCQQLHFWDTFSANSDNREWRMGLNTSIFKQEKANIKNHGLCQTHRAWPTSSVHRRLPSPAGPPQKRSVAARSWDQVTPSTRVRQPTTLTTTWTAASCRTWPVRPTVAAQMGESRGEKRWRYSMGDVITLLTTTS